MGTALELGQLTRGVLAMSTLHLTVLNEGKVYDRLRAIARKVHDGVWSDRRAWVEYRDVVEKIARAEMREFDDVRYTPADVDAATDEVADYHKRRMAEDQA